MFKFIPLSNSDKKVLVDASLYDFLMKRKWRIDKHGYAFTRVKGKTVLMHRFINQTPEGLLTDHINNNKLDNRMCNLRSCTPSQNRANSKVNNGGNRNKSSKYRGVCKYRKGWLAQVSVNGVPKKVGYFPDEVDAAKAYDKVAKEVYGEFAVLNFPSSDV